MKARILGLGLMLCLLCGCGDIGTEAETTGMRISESEITESEPDMTEAASESEAPESEAVTAGEVVTTAASEAPLPEKIELPDGVVGSIEDADAAAVISELAALTEAYDFSVSYRSGDGIHALSIGGEKRYRSASTIKAMYCQYLYCAGTDEAREILFDAQEVRTSVTGKLTADKRGKRFTVGELIGYTIVSSDNMAYRMLFEEFGVEGYNDWVRELGLSGLAFPTAEYEFFDVDADSLSGGMLEILRYSGEDGRLVELLKGAEFKLMGLNTEYEVASKYGYEGGVMGYHDTGIIFAPTPYVLTVMTNMDANREDAGLPFFEAVRLFDELNRILYRYE